ncbi:MAG TPA: efflux RND transporter periplasmic adaptor subunit [Gemmataceae bacterium]|jgi:HlyD family secretion protein|nr:efflux RND transporter periplasmic adaptor subunit [Gemmataceae bacterium]
MKRLRRWAIVLGILVAGGWAISVPAGAYFRERGRVSYREAEVSRGSVVAVVNSTGTVKPVQQVSVSTFVSGPIASIAVDFNDEVKKGDLLAVIDPRIYAAAVAQARAYYANQKAGVERAKAQLQQARNDEARSVALRTENRTFISDTEMDQFKYKRMMLEAELSLAETAVDQARASLDTAEANLNYTRIISPVNGVIIDRKVDPGQTVAASFQVPEMFVVAPDMRKEMHVFASVDEADIGLIRSAQKAGQPVRFTVDAHPDDLFTGHIFQIRQNATTNQNVVTYPVVVSAPNPDLKLLPQMTASLSFQVGEVNNVLRVPNAALRFYPQREQVRTEDRKLLEAAANTATDDQDRSDSNLSAQDKAEARRRRNRRHVWVVEGDFLRAIPVVTGLSDSKHTELVSGDVHEGDKLVTGIQPKN